MSLFKNQERLLSNKYRNEIKYLITNNEKIILRNRLDNLLKKDVHILEESYHVTTLYFDDLKKTSYYQVVNGLGRKWKWRIRFYNNDDSYICLEKKEKLNGLVKKQQIRITKKQVEDIMIAKNIAISKDNDILLNELYLSMISSYLRPKIIIEYERIPYIYNAGNVRLVFDYNISVCDKIDQLFDKNKKLIPIMEKDSCILEVKYNGFIPDHIRYKLALNSLNQTSYSKYFHGMKMFENVL